MIVVALSIHGVLDSLRREASAFDYFDWALLGFALVIGFGACRWQVAQARLGTVKVVAKPDSDTDAVAPHVVIALSEALSDRGLMAPGVVPTGTPKADVVAAVAAAPIEQNQFLAAILKLVPIPASSLNYEIDVTLRSDGGENKGGLSYILMDLNRSAALKVGTEWAATTEAAVPNAADAIYRQIGRHADDVYPRWATWPTTEALSTYRAGLGLEKTGDISSALQTYRTALARAPTNMLVRLRIANLLESTGSVSGQLDAQIASLGEYLDIAGREPSIYQALYRASVLLGLLADQAGSVSPDSERQVRRLVRATSPGETEMAAMPTGAPEALAFATALLREADRLAGCAKQRLAKTWTLRRQGRLRNRYEVKGTKRRQARTAHAVFKWSLLIRAMLVDEQATEGAGSLQCTRELHPWLYGLCARRSGPTEAQTTIDRCCELIDSSIRMRFLGIRWARAGWEAHYNAACCYALCIDLLSDSSRQQTIAGRAFHHLQFALAQGGTSISCEYVAQGDPDLAALRSRGAPWHGVLRSLYGRFAFIDYRRTSSPVEGWGLHVWGDGAGTPTTWDRPLTPVRVVGNDASFVVHLGTPGKVISLLPHDQHSKDCEIHMTSPPGDCVSWSMEEGNTSLTPIPESEFDTPPAAAPSLAPVDGSELG